MPSLKYDTSVTVVAPASLSNVGPGFDRLGIAITGWNDTVVANLRTDSTFALRVETDGSSDYPSNPEDNVCSIAARHFLRATGYGNGMDIVLKKGIPLGSGIGGSGASSAAGAVAAAMLTNQLENLDQIITAALHGEARASGTGHPDNVMPSLLGGLVLSDMDGLASVTFLQHPVDALFVVLLPDWTSLTSEMRALLPPYSRTVQARNAVRAKYLVDALVGGDARAAGRWMMTDEYAEPRRLRRLPFFERVKSAALGSQACGCALSGSGPAVMSLCENEDDAADVLLAMVEALGQPCDARIVRVSERGALMSAESDHDSAR